LIRLLALDHPAPAERFVQGNQVPDDLALARGQQILLLEQRPLRVEVSLEIREA